MSDLTPAGAAAARNGAAAVRLASRVAALEAERDQWHITARDLADKVARVEALADEYSNHPATAECRDDDGWRCAECTHARAIRVALAADPAPDTTEADR